MSRPPLRLASSCQRRARFLRFLQALLLTSSALSNAGASLGSELFSVSADAPCGYNLATKPISYQNQYFTSVPTEALAARKEVRGTWKSRRTPIVDQLDPGRIAELNCGFRIAAAEIGDAAFSRTTGTLYCCCFLLFEFIAMD